jgi:hypothetical protein
MRRWPLADIELRGWPVAEAETQRTGDYVKQRARTLPRIMTQPFYPKLGSEGAEPGARALDGEALQALEAVITWQQRDVAGVHLFGVEGLQLHYEATGPEPAPRLLASRLEAAAIAFSE